jgi:hypothetical protein
MNEMELLRVDPLSVGRIMGVLYFGLSMLLAVPMGLLGLMQGGGEGVVGLGVALVLPFVYGVFAGIMGAIMGLVYNVAAGFVGGLRLTVTE